MRLIDGRKFGGLWLAEDPAAIQPPLSPELLGGEFTTEWVAASLAGRNAPVEALLPGLSIAAGLGNLYADESLFLSRIRAYAHGTARPARLNPVRHPRPAVFVPEYRRATKWLRRRGWGLR